MTISVYQLSHQQVGNVHIHPLTLSKDNLVIVCTLQNLLFPEKEYKLVGPKVAIPYFIINKVMTCE